MAWQHTRENLVERLCEKVGIVREGKKGAHLTRMELMKLNSYIDVMTEGDFKCRICKDPVIVRSVRCQKCTAAAVPNASR